MFTVTLLAALLAQVCPAGQSMSADTAGHCCWPSQAWSRVQNRCVGVPSACPGGKQVEGEACVTSCPVGMAANEDTQGNCCWPGQAWSKTRGVCVGLPSACPAGQQPQGETCVKSCPAGMAANEDTQGNCCWPGQAWSKTRAVCVGVPQCGPGFVAAGEGCAPAGASYPAQPYAPQAGQPYSPQPVQPSPTPPAQPYATQPGQPAAPQPAQPYAAQPGQPAATQPAPPYAAQPGQPNAAQPDQSSPAQPNVATPRSPLQGTPSTGDSPAPAAVVKTEPKPPTDPYLEYGRFDVRLELLADFAAPAMGGLQAGFAFTIARASFGRLGISANAGLLVHPDFDSFHARNVTLLGGEAFGALRLGQTSTELQVRFGLVAAGIHQYEQSLWLPKLHAGASIFRAFTRGGMGLTLGFDVYFLSGASFVPRFGWVF